MDKVFLFDKTYITHQLQKTTDFKLTEKAPGPCDILFRWGSLAGEDIDANLVINRKSALRNCMDKETLYEILRLNKVRRPRFVYPNPDSNYPLLGKKYTLSANRQGETLVRNYDEAVKAKADFFVEYVPILKKYKVYVFNYGVIKLQKKMQIRSNSDSLHQWSYEDIPATLDKETIKVANFAKRAVYVLGLDFGLVYVGVDEKTRPVALDVDPVPLLSTPFLEKIFASIITSYKELNRAKKDIMLGADPEFILRDKQLQKLMYPSDYVTKEGPIGYDERSERREGRLFPLAEIRPDPDFCPLRLSFNIYFLLQRANALFPENLEWLGGSTHYGQYHLGGHIHFSNVALSSALLRALDNYLNIPLFLIENPETAVLRRKQYGWIGSVREKDHGGFEYRTPASWLISPAITKAALCLAKIVSTEFRNLQKDFFLDINLQKAFYQGKHMHFYEIYNKLWKDLSQTETFHQYAQYLLPMEKMILNKETWNEEKDFKSAWGLN